MPTDARWLVVLLPMALAVAPGRAAPPPGVELADGGRTIVYRARPGDSAIAVAQALGVAPIQMVALLAAQGVRDPDRVPVGFEYRVPNPLAERAAAAEGRAEDLARRLAATEVGLAGAARDRAAATPVAAAPGVERQRLTQLEGRWRLARWAIAGLALALAVTGAVAAIARRRERGATHYARTMAHELEEQRRRGLADRQQSARRIVELEDRLRRLEGGPENRVRTLPRSA